METVNLKAAIRTELGRQNKKLKAEKKIPGVLYGRGFENLNLTFEKKEFDKIFKSAGSSTIVDLNIDGQSPIKTLILEPQHDPITGYIIHADLYKVNMKEEIHTEIPLVFVGEAPAVKDLEGNLITSKDAVEVKCLPDKLVSEIEVDISVLKTFEDSIKISDLIIPEGIELLAEPEEIVAMVSAPRSEAELEEMEAPVTDEQAAIEKLDAESVSEKAEEVEEKEEEKK